MARCHRVMKLEAHICAPAESGGQSHFTGEDMYLVTVCHQPLTPLITHTTKLWWKHLRGELEEAALPRPFLLGLQAIWNRPQQKGVANLQLWAGILMGRLGSGWVVWRIQNKTTVRDPPWENFSQLNSVIGNERNMWKRV